MVVHTLLQCPCWRPLAASCPGLFPLALFLDAVWNIGGLIGDPPATFQWMYPTAGGCRAAESHPEHPSERCKAW